MFLSKSQQALARELVKHFDMHISRANCLIVFVFAMIKVRSVNLARVSCAIKGKSKQSSIFRRLQRWIAEISLSEGLLAQFLVTALGLDQKQRWILCMDRTNWMFGKTHINVLYLGISVGSMAIPLFWILLEDKKRGNSDAMDRIDLLESFNRVFGKERIEVITADREFIGPEWLNYLEKHGIDYAIRLKENGQYLSNTRGEMVRIVTLFRSLAPGQSQALGKRLVGKTNPVTAYVSAYRSGKGELCVLIHMVSLQDPIDAYSQRWDIEVMFKAFKSNGFDMEATHITHPDRLHTLMQVIAVAAVIAYKEGLFVEKQDPRPLKKHGYRHKSIFRQGLDSLCQILAAPQYFYRYSNKIINGLLASLCKLRTAIVM